MYYLGISKLGFLSRLRIALNIILQINTNVEIEKSHRIIANGNVINSIIF